MSLLYEERRAMNLQVETLKKQLEESKRKSSFEEQQRGREIRKLQKEIAVKRSADRFQERKKLRDQHFIKRNPKKNIIVCQDVRLKDCSKKINKRVEFSPVTTKAQELVPSQNGKSLRSNKLSKSQDVRCLNTSSKMNRYVINCVPTTDSDKVAQNTIHVDLYDFSPVWYDVALDAKVDYNAILIFED